jgi:LPS-assembly protein
MQLTGKMKKGAMRNLLMISANLSRTAAATARRDIGDRGQQVNELDHAVFSACDACEGGDTRVWQIKAARIVHDEADKDVVYTDATVEMFGMPIAYSPYLSHADPTVKRRSGFLFPGMGSSSNVGLYAKVPYYYVTSPHSDVTLAPMLTSDDPSILIGEYRQKLADASFIIDASGRAGESDENRGHIGLRGEWDVNEVWRGTADLRAVSTDTYMRRYKINQPNDYLGKRDPMWDSSLTNRIAMEGFAGDDYARVEGLSFRELRNLTTTEKNPIALPRADWTHVGERGARGGYWTTALSTASLNRANGADSTRVSASSTWTLPYVAPSGEHYTLTTALRGDAYQIDKYKAADGSVYSGTAGRIIPEASLRWSWPFASAGERTTQVIEPVLIGTVSPNGGNPTKIPNEDSRDLEFDDTTVLSRNRFIGYDRVETGPRGTYGVNWNAYVNGTSNQMSAFAGQTYRLHEDSVFAESSGLRKGFSDYVGRVRYVYGSYFNTTYRVRMNQSNFDLVSNDLSVSGGTDPLRASVAYLNQRNRFRTSSDTSDDVEQLSFGLTSRLTRDWAITSSFNNDLTQDGGPLSFSTYATYEDECFLLRLTATRDYTSTATRKGDGASARTLFSRASAIPRSACSQIRAG